MKNKGTIMFVLGLLALTLSFADRVYAKGGATAEPITYDFVRYNVLTHLDQAALKKMFDEEGRKGMRYVVSESVTGEPGAAVHIFASR